MKKEIKESISNNLIEKMDKKLSRKEDTKQVMEPSKEEERFLTKEEFDRVAAYYMTHVGEPLDILFHDLDNAYRAYIVDGAIFHSSITNIIDEYKDKALKQTIRPLIAVQVLGEGNEKKVGGCQRITKLEREDGVERVFEECLELYKRKNHDYSNKGESAFDKAYKKMGAKSLWLRLNDKFTRFESLLFAEDEAQVKDEKIEDTLLDLINYAAMGLAKLKGYN